jgi:hypothetical protein
METKYLAKSDVELVEQPRSPPLRKVVGAAAAVALFGTGAWMGNHMAPQGQVSRHAGELQQLTQIIAKPKRGQCSKTKENCLRTGCCATVGHTCFQTKKDMGKCLKRCTPSATQMCTQPQFVMDPILQDAVPQSTSLYCFSVYTQDTGSTKISYELDILKEQHARNIGIFLCEQSDVFADVDVEVGPGLRTIQVDDVEGDFHLAKRKTSGTWVNTGMFTQIWKKITKHVYTDWVAKVDADAVFIPDRLRSWLGGQLVPSNGIYLENCKYVDYGYFGNLEVFSKAAFTTLVANIDMCKASPEINWKVGIKNGKYGPMGEDLFAQTCLDMKGVRRVEAFDITTDGACPADRPHDQQKNKKWKPNCAETSTAAMHPFKKKDEWFQCWEATVAAFGH